MKRRALSAPEFFRISARYPLVHISIYRNFSHKILQRIEDGSPTVGIRHSAIKSPNLKMHHIYKDRCAHVAQKNLAHPLQGHSRRSAEHPSFFPHWLHPQVLDKPLPPLSRAHPLAMECPVSADQAFRRRRMAGLSIISESFAKDYVKAGEVKLLTVEGVGPLARARLVYRRDPQPPPAARPSSA